MTSTIKVNNIQNQCGANIINENSNTITIGASGDTIALASGASQTGFGREGSVNWQTGSIKTTTFTAVSGEGYFVDTSSGAVTMNLPAGVAGAIVAVADYTRTFNNNNLTVAPNGSNKIGGVAEDAKLTVNGQSATFVFVDATEGWINVQETQTSQTGVPPFIGATGGTITTCGNCTVHTFTGPGTFSVSRLATASPAPANNQVSYMVVAGGGGAGGGDNGGGGGAGGFREDKSPVTPYTASPLEGAGPITVAVQDYPITVGGGGAAAAISSPSVNVGRRGSSGNTSTFSTISSAGGGGGAAAYSSSPDGNAGAAGGSGGGGGMCGSPAGGGSGNTPPVSPSQGNNGGSSGPGGGGTGSPKYGASGGGGATAVGQDGTPAKGGDGGAGATTGINFSNTAFAGGGGGGAEGGGCSTGGTGGGGPGAGSSPACGTPGTANTGGGGGSAGSNNPSTSVGSGGSGIVIIRYKSGS